MAKTRNFAQVIRRKLQSDPGLADAVDSEAVSASIATLIYHVRTEAGLTQTQLAEKVGTVQPVIARLENSDYDGHSLMLLRKIGAALRRRLTINFEEIPSCEIIVAPQPVTELSRIEWTIGTAWHFDSKTTLSK